jgi:hypothetical protein
MMSRCKETLRRAGGRGRGRGDQRDEVRGQVGAVADVRGGGRTRTGRRSRGGGRWTRTAQFLGSLVEVMKLLRGEMVVHHSFDQVPIE